jgi:hypothetical protein
MRKNSPALKVTLSNSDFLQNVLRAEASKPHPYHEMWTFIQHQFNCKSMREVDFFKPEKTRDFLSCLAYLTQDVPQKEVEEIQREANCQIDERGKVNFYQLPTYLLRDLQRILFPYMKPSFLDKYVYEDLDAIELDDDMFCDENTPPNVKDLSKDLLKPSNKENTFRKDSFDEEEEESFF